MQIALGHRCGEQLSTLGAAHLDGPALPLAVSINAQIQSDEFRQLKRSFGAGKFTDADMNLRVLRVRKSKTILGHGQLGLGGRRKSVIKTALTSNCDNH
jgi:hypothetical protein